MVTQCSSFDLTIYIRPHILAWVSEYKSLALRYEAFIFAIWTLGLYATFKDTDTTLQNIIRQVTTFLLAWSILFLCFIVAYLLCQTTQQHRKDKIYNHKAELLTVAFVRIMWPQMIHLVQFGRGGFAFLHFECVF